MKITSVLVGHELRQHIRIVLHWKHARIWRWKISNDMNNIEWKKTFRINVLNRAFHCRLNKPGYCYSKTKARHKLTDSTTKTSQITMSQSMHHWPVDESSKIVFRNAWKWRICMRVMIEGNSFWRLQNEREREKTVPIFILSSMIH